MPKVAGQNKRLLAGRLHKQYLMTWSVSWRCDNLYSAIVEAIIIACDQLGFCPHGLRQQSRRLTVMSVVRYGPFVFLLIQDPGRAPERIPIADMVDMFIRESTKTVLGRVSAHCL